MIKRDLSQASQASAPASIIVADDDKSVRLVIAQALKKQGYIVHTAATAAGMWDLSLRYFPHKSLWSQV